VCAVCRVDGSVAGDTFTISTVVGDEYTFQSPNAGDIQQLVEYFLVGLRRRSRYMIAIADRTGTCVCAPTLL
jgi:hypothetical protein